jgi:hypothetical protein
VATLAAISVDFYTRLERGPVAASASVLATLARALRLDDDQEAYRHEIAGKSDAPPAPPGSPDGSGQQLMIVTAEPGTPFHDALRILASWSTTASTVQ